MSKNGAKIYQQQSVDIFLTHYPTHHRLPAWVIMQCQDFGMLCQFFKRGYGNKKLASQVAQNFKIQKSYQVDQLGQLFNALRHIRNLCVHNEKLLGESIRIAPPLFTGVANKNSNRIIHHCFWIEHLLKSITERDSFSKELKEIIKTVNEGCPSSMHLNP